MTSQWSARHNPEVAFAVHLWDSNKWVRSRRCACLVTWLCYHLIAKPDNKTTPPLWPDPNKPDISRSVLSMYSHVSPIPQIVHQFGMYYLGWEVCRTSFVIPRNGKSFVMARYGLSFVMAKYEMSFWWQGIRDVFFIAMYMGCFLWLQGIWDVFCDIQVMGCLLCVKSLEALSIFMWWLCAEQVTTGSHW